MWSIVKRAINDRLDAPLNLALGQREDAAAGAVSNSHSLMGYVKHLMGRVGASGAGVGGLRSRLVIGVATNVSSGTGTQGQGWQPTPDSTLLNINGRGVLTGLGIGMAAASLPSARELFINVDGNILTLNGSEMTRLARRQTFNPMPLNIRFLQNLTLTYRRTGAGIPTDDLHEIAYACAVEF